MICEQCNIKTAQDNLYKWCLNNLPIGRSVTQEDVEGIERVTEDNLKDRERIFGNREWVWYPVYKGFWKGGLV